MTPAVGAAAQVHSHRERRGAMATHAAGRAARRPCDDDRYGRSLAWHMPYTHRAYAHALYTSRVRLAGPARAWPRAHRVSDDEEAEGEEDQPPQPPQLADLAPVDGADP